MFFFEVFEDLKVEDRLKKIFENISVTNITGDATIDILVIGALDPSEGVAIMLSPEAAEAIGIRPGWCA